LGRAQLAFWNQGSKTIFLAKIPDDPRHTEPWPYEPIFSGNAGEGAHGAALYAEGMDADDVDGDGRIDLLAGNYWFKYEANGTFEPIRVGTIWRAHQGREIQAKQVSTDRDWPGQRVRPPHDV
jgi:hypothetical protein